MDNLPGDVYEIVVKEPLDQTWSEWFDGFTLLAAGDEGTKILGRIRDQTALHGLLAKIRNLNLTLIAIKKISGKGEASGNE